jgi:hypothetical protein
MTQEIKKFVAIRRVVNSLFYAWTNKPKRQDEQAHGGCEIIGGVLGLKMRPVV